MSRAHGTRKGTVTGGSIHAGGSVASQAHADLATAYDIAVLRTPGSACARRPRRPDARPLLRGTDHGPHLDHGAAVVTV